MARTPGRAHPNEPSELWRRYKRLGDRAARERLVLAYAPLVKYVAGRVGASLPAHVDHADLVSYGFEGLLTAIERFDSSREASFETFALPRIRGAIVDQLRVLDWVPRSVRDKARSIERANAALELRLGRAPTEAQLAAELSVTVGELGRWLTDVANSSLLSLDEAFAAREGTRSALADGTDLDTQDPAGLAQARELKQHLAAAITRLPERERLVVSLHYYDELSLVEVAHVLGVSGSRASQLHAQAMLRLRPALAEHRTRSR